MIDGKKIEDIVDASKQKNKLIIARPGLRVGIFETTIRKTQENKLSKSREKACIEGSKGCI